MQNLDNVYIWTMFFIGQERKRYEGGGGETKICICIKHTIKEPEKCKLKQFRIS